MTNSIVIGFGPYFGAFERFIAEIAKLKQYKLVKHWPQYQSLNQLFTVSYRCVCVCLFFGCCCTKPKTTTYILTDRFSLFDGQLKIDFIFRENW